MPRQPRQKNESCICHVMLKVIDGRYFLPEWNRKKFLSQVLQAQGKGGFSLLAYCLMNIHDHAHSLSTEKEGIGTTAVLAAIIKKKYPVIPGQELPR